MEKKKNSKHYIIPASYFIKKGIIPIPVKKPETPSITEEIMHNEEEKEQSASTKTTEVTTTPKIVEERPKIILNQGKKIGSGLSLSSIKAKKEHQIRQMEVVLDEEELPKDDFTVEQVVKAWNNYVKELEKNGKYNLASILSIDTPKVKETTIHLEYPNATNKVEVERNQYDLLGFIRKAVNNFDINLSIAVNEEMEKQYAYTPMEKYEKLKEKNPNLDTLRKTFNLDI